MKPVSDLWEAKLQLKSRSCSTGLGMTLSERMNHEIAKLRLRAVASISVWTILDTLIVLFRVLRRVVSWTVSPPQLPSLPIRILFCKTTYTYNPPTKF